MKYIFLFFVFFLSFLSQGQVVIDTIAKETCSCLNSKNLEFNNNTDLSKIEIELEHCMIANVINYNTFFKDKSQMEYLKSKNLEILGREIGLKMLIYCPNFMLNFSSIHNEIKKKNKKI